MFWINDLNFNLRYQINDQKLSAFGDLIGGLIGSLWTLAGFILYYVALKDQRKDIKINQDNLEVQVETLNQQIKEYKLQTDELVQTRKVLNEQSSTLLKQQFESTFFNSINLLNAIIDKFIIVLPSSRKIWDAEKNVNRMQNYDIKLLGKDVFSNYLEKLREAYLQYCRENVVVNSLDASNSVIIEYDFEKDSVIIKTIALQFFNDYQKELGHYFRTVNNIVKLIIKDSAKISDFKFYNDIFMDQFSSEELILLFYYFVVFEEKYQTKQYIEENGFFRNLNKDLILNENHKSLYKEIAYFN